MVYLFDKLQIFDMRKYKTKYYNLFFYISNTFHSLQLTDLFLLYFSFLVTFPGMV